MPRNHLTSSSGGVDDEGPANSPLQLRQLEAKIRENPKYRECWYKFLRGESGATLLDAELEYRIGSGQRNVIIEVYGPPGIGKSMVARTIRKNIWRRLKKRGIRNPFALTWNYFQSKEQLFKYNGTGERATVIQDEDKLMSGPDIEIGRKAFLNFLKQGRKLGHNLIKCDTIRDSGIADWVAFALRVWGQLENSLLCMFEDGNGEPLAFIKVRLPCKAERDHYEKEKDKSLHKLSQDRGNVGVEQTDDDANSLKVYQETIKIYGGLGKLSKDHFVTISRKLFGYKGLENSRRWGGLAWAKYKNERIHEPKYYYPVKSRQEYTNNEDEESIEKLGKTWETEFAEQVAPTLYKRYTKLGGKGQPDGIGEFSDELKEIVALECTMESVSKTVFVGEKSAKREKEAGRLYREIVFARTLTAIDPKVRRVIALYLKSQPLNKYYKHEFDLDKPRVHTFHFLEDTGYPIGNTEKEAT